MRNRCTVSVADSDIAVGEDRSIVLSHRAGIADQRLRGTRAPATCRSCSITTPSASGLTSRRRRRVRRRRGAPQEDLRIVGYTGARDHAAREMKITSAPATAPASRVHAARAMSCDVLRATVASPCCWRDCALSGTPLPRSRPQATRRRHGRQLSAVIFRTDGGKLQGIIKDKWALWSRKTVSR